MTATSTLTLSAFLLARYDEESTCEGSGEYAGCADQWERDERIKASLRAVVELHSSDRHPCPAYNSCRALLALAQPWRDHPDMRPEWVTG